MNKIKLRSGDVLVRNKFGYTTFEMYVEKGADKSDLVCISLSNAFIYDTLAPYKAGTELITRDLITGEQSYEYLFNIKDLVKECVNNT